MKLINADKVIEKLKEHKSLFCKNRDEFRTLSDKDKARVDEIDTCIAELVNAEEVPPAQLSTNLAEVGADCISRQQAIDALNEYFARIGKLKRRGLTKGEKAISLDTVGTIKTLSPAQPDIIRCRNCKFASGDSRICMKFGHSPIGELDFCAWAERRTDE